MVTEMSQEGGLMLSDMIQVVCEVNVTLHQTVK